MSDRIVVCRHCKQAVYRMTKARQAGDIISADDFEGINDFESPTAGHNMDCPACGESLKSSLEQAVGTA